MAPPESGFDDTGVFSIELDVAGLVDVVEGSSLVELVVSDAFVLANVEVTVIEESLGYTEYAAKLSLALFESMWQA